MIDTDKFDIAAAETAGPDAVNGPDFTDRDREMFCLGYEFATTCLEIYMVAVGDLPAHRVMSMKRTIHAANLPRLADYFVGCDLQWNIEHLSDEWRRITVVKKAP